MWHPGEQSGQLGVAAGRRGPVEVNDRGALGLEVAGEVLETQVDDAGRRAEQVQGVVRVALHLGCQGL